MEDRIENLNEDEISGNVKIFLKKLKKNFFIF